MIVFDPAAASSLSQIFQIKHSEEAVRGQYRHLIDEEKCAQTEHMYGPITGKTVLYREENWEMDAVRYWNVEEYLKDINI
ncbi:hypothetical protein [uncultured Clostridium sp.]|uniref:hypothetical protein n=1 Tax=uncultured Clostridium sp. TaxID=59620 RepID=UPI00266C7A25|nr:hypothetical protein [uncultured Clostridium sp.]